MKKRKSLKKVVTLVLATVMVVAPVISSKPLNAYAESAENNLTVSENNGLAASSRTAARVIDTFTPKQTKVNTKYTVLYTWKVKKYTTDTVWAVYNFSDGTTAERNIETLGRTATTTISGTDVYNTNKPMKSVTLQIRTSKNVVCTKRTELVVSNSEPVIYANDKTIQQGEWFNPYAGVSAWDAEDGNLTHMVAVVKNNVNTNVPGTYYVTYEVTDSDGNTVQKTITVTVQGKETSGTITPNIYTLGESYITGTYTGDVAYADLYINGVKVDTGGSFNNGYFSYAVNSNLITSSTTQVYLAAYDKNGKLLDRKSVPICAKGYGAIIPNEYHMGSSEITGTYTGDVSYAELYVNGSYVSRGGTFANGYFTYWIDKNLVKSVTTPMSLIAYDKNGKVLNNPIIFITDK